MEDPVREGKLTLYSKGLSDQRLQKILDDPRSGAITEIIAPNNLLSAAAIGAITRAQSTAGLVTLYLNDNRDIGDEGLKTLAASPRLATLKRVQLSHINATPEGVAALAGSAHIAGLIELRLALNEVGDTGAEALSATSGVALLDLRKSSVGPAGARALIQATSTASLILDDNPLGAGALTPLSGVSPGLKALQLDRCGLSPADIQALAKLPATSLETLSLKDNTFDDAALDAIAAAPWFAQLKILDLVAHQASKQARARLKAAWGDRKGLTLFARDL